MRQREAVLQTRANWELGTLLALGALFVLGFRPGATLRHVPIIGPISTLVESTTQRAETTIAHTSLIEAVAPSVHRAVKSVTPPPPPVVDPAAYRLIRSFMIPRYEEAIPVLKAAGFTGPKLVTVLAIGDAETNLQMERGDVGIPGPECDSVTFLQINWCPADLGIPGQDAYWRNKAQENQTNWKIGAEAAWYLSGAGTYWRPWTTYRVGAYLQYLTESANAVQLIH